MVRQTKGLILILVSILFFASCSTQKRFDRQKAKATNFFLLNKSELAKLCKDEFPSNPAEHISTNVIKDTTIIVLPGIEKECEKQGQILKCPDCKEIKITETIIDSVKILDTVSVRLLKDELDKSIFESKEKTQKIDQLSLKYYEEKAAKSKYLWILIALASINVVYIVFKIYSKFRVA